MNVLDVDLNSWDAQGSPFLLGQGVAVAAGAVWTPVCEQLRSSSRTPLQL